MRKLYAHPRLSIDTSIHQPPRAALDIARALELLPAP
jgi:hypothetical protein